MSLIVSRELFMPSSLPVFETILTDSHQVACDGGNGALGHPRVYLHLDGGTGEVTCPYCSRLYQFRVPNVGASA